jgi:hypothetical protein
MATQRPHTFRGERGIGGWPGQKKKKIDQTGWLEFLVQTMLEYHKKMTTMLKHMIFYFSI